MSGPGTMRTPVFINVNDVVKLLPRSEASIQLDHLGPISGSDAPASDRDPKGRDPAGGSGRPRSGRVEPGPREAGSRPNRTPGGKGLEEKTVGEGAGHRLRYCQNSSGTWAAQYQVPDALFAGSTPAPNPPQRPQTAQ